MQPPAMTNTAAESESTRAHCRERVALPLKRRLNIVGICKSLDGKGLTKKEAYPLWSW